MTKPWLSAADVVSLLGSTKDTVFASTVEKNKPANNVGRTWKFQVGKIDYWVHNGVFTASDGTAPR